MMSSWWVPARIEATVTRTFVVNHLVQDEVDRLDCAVAFGGEDLTERTYWDSIQNSAKSIFLILVDLGIPDQIFGIIDDGWNDGELPLSLDDIDRLQLTAVKDDRIDRKFYQRQLHYVLRTIDRGVHIAFADHDVVALDIVDRSSGPTSKGHLVDKVKLPNAPNFTFSRRRYPLGNGPGCVPHQEFFDAVNSVKALQNDHIVSYWGSYTYQGAGFILLTPSSDFTLKSFLATTPSSFKNLSKRDRRQLIMNWILCLVDTMAFLHKRNRSHCYIKPSTTLFNNQNHIFFADPTRLSPDAWIGHADKASFDREWYDYAAPEQWFRPAGPTSPPSRKATMSFSTSPDNTNFNISRGFDQASTPTAMLQTPNPQLNPETADIFSLGCIVLELLSFLMKRSSSKFATFRSAKHKTAGRGGAVLDTSFHKNLGQVESWMSGLAKDASKKVTDSEVDGANVFKGITPMLHVVTGMLSVNPYDRPSAVEVQQRMYQILTDYCNIQEPHCVHQYTADVQYALSRLNIQPGHDAMNARQPHAGYGTTPRTFQQHGRTNSSGGYSQNSRASSSNNTTGSSEREEDMGYAARGVPMGQPIRSPGGWPVNSGPAYLGNQASVYATAQ